MVADLGATLTPLTLVESLKRKRAKATSWKRSAKTRMADSDSSDENVTLNADSSDVPEESQNV